RAERYLQTTRVVGVYEIVVALGIGAKHRIIASSGEGQRRTATPATHELRREKLALLLGMRMFLQEPVEGAHKRLIFAKADEGAIASQFVGLRHRQRHASLGQVVEDELASLDRAALTGQRIHAAALDSRLADHDLVAER